MKFNYSYVVYLMRDHLLLFIVLLIAFGIYAFIPLQLQSSEPYQYAAAIEQYYRNSIGFSLAQGDYLPDFGRYHPNHPLGHVLAGWAYDWLRIPALTWMKFINTVAAFFLAVFFYLMLLRIRFSKVEAAVTVGSLLASYFGLFAVLSGEWHLPAMALCFAAFWEMIPYLERGEKKYLFRASLWFAIGSCYHLSVFFYSIPLGLVLLFVRPLKDRWRELFTAAAMISLLLLVVYVAIPFYLFKFHSVQDFLRTFLIYKYITYMQYSGFDWVLIAARAIFHTVVFTPAQLNGTNFYVAFFFLMIAFGLWRYFRSTVMLPVKAWILLTHLFAFFGYWLLGARPDALLGWLLLLPFICLVTVKAFADLHRRAFIGIAAVIVLMLGWNLALAILPNSLSKRENIFYFKVPRQTPSTTPVAFVISSLLFMEAEIWHAGSELGYRNQKHFMPCCGENDYYSRLRRWTREHPGFILVADGRHDVLENFLKAEGLRYKRWADSQGNWPSSLIQNTLYFQHIAPKFFPRRLTIWVPEELLQ
ncbi:MAG: hypothetical protein ACOY5B_04725 [Spirochaetota bacterium]